MFSKKLFAIIAIIALCSVSVFAASWNFGNSGDASERFTDVNNGGVWSTGVFDGSNHSAYTYMEIPSLGLYGWNLNGENDSHGNYLKNVSGTTYDGLNSGLSSYWENGAIVLGSSPIVSEYMYITFTAPADGNYAFDFNGFARGIQNSGSRTSTLVYYANGQAASAEDLALISSVNGTLDNSGNYIGEHVEAIFSETVNMKAGDMFTIYINNDGSNAAENMGLTFTAAEAEVPEPASMVVLFSGIAGMSAYAIRRKK